jgi:hypothetical protein
MNRLRLLTAALAIVALPTGVLGGPNNKPIKVKKDKAKTEKSVPAPPALVLMGVAAGVACLIRRRQRRRTSR